MEAQNMIKKIAIGLVSLSVPILIGLSIYQHIQIRKLSQEVTQETALNNDMSGHKASETARIAQNDISEDAPSLSNRETPNKDDINEIQDQLDATEKELDGALAQLSDELSRQAELKKLEEENRAKSHVEYFKSTLDSKYGPLFKDLNLSTYKLIALKQLLVDKYANSMEFGQEIVNGKKWIYSGENETKVEEYDTKIREFLGDDDYGKYILFTDSIGERSWVSNFIKYASPEEPLTADQQQDLINAMYENRKNIQSELDNHGSLPDSVSEMDEGKISLIMEKRDHTNEAYISAAKDILSESQARQFENYLNESRDRYEASLKESFGNK